MTGLIAVVVFAAGGTGGDIQKVDPSVHFHPKGKPPSEHTLDVLNQARESMPFEDTRDFDEARKGFIAPLLSKIVEADAGHVAWDIERYEFLKADEGWPSVHPSTQRQGHLNQVTGLFEVGEGIYQVRGLDLANITFVRGEKGWIVFDPLTALETAFLRAIRAAPDEESTRVLKDRHDRERKRSISASEEGRRAWTVSSAARPSSSVAT